MSTAKRSRQRQADASAATSLPPAKRTKVTQEHPSTLAFLTDERRRAGKTIQANSTNGVNNGRVNRVDETKAAIANQHAADDIDEEIDDSDGDSDLSSSSEEPSESSEDERDPAEDTPMTNGVSNHDATKNNKDAGLDSDIEDDEALQDTAATTTKTASERHTNGVERTDDDDEPADAGPSFGEMLQVQHPDIIDVSASFDDGEPRNRALVPAAGSKVLQAPSATSLGTVLSQALRTNDRELLESCLQTKSLASIKSTIQRLQSPLVATLMQKLAERLHKRPGRAGSLMIWIQWSLVAHGGYLSGQPQIVHKLRSLRQVIRDRAVSLPALITLKGKLDMLSAQVELRRSMRVQRNNADESDEDEDDVVQVEGEDEGFSSASEDEPGAIEAAKPAGRFSKRIPINTRDTAQDEGADVDDDIPLINGIDEDAEMESLADGEDDEDEGTAGFIDDEAEESEGDESISSEEDYSGSESADEDDLDDESGSSDDEEIAAPAKSARPIKRNSLIRKR